MRPSLGRGYHVRVEPRPFYHQFAWAYDLLAPTSAAALITFTRQALGERGIAPPSRVLDAGCGTGGLAVELARCGFATLGLDRGLPLLREAQAKARRVGVAVGLAAGDLRALPLRDAVDGVVCRGVLNDLVSDEDRERAVAGLAAALRPGGVVLLDVREWAASAARYAGGGVFERTVEVGGGTLTFRSESRLDPARRCLLVHERHAWTHAGGTTDATNDFEMRCWTREELHARLSAAGLAAIEHLDGAPLPSDRMVVAASRRP